MTSEAFFHWAVPTPTDLSDAAPRAVAEAMPAAAMPTAEIYVENPQLPQEAGGAARTALSVRDLLAWAGFVRAAAPAVGLLPAYAHGAHLVLLDGIGLGLGMPPQVGALDVGSIQLGGLDTTTVISNLDQAPSFPPEALQPACHGHSAHAALCACTCPRTAAQHGSDSLPLHWCPE